MYSPRAYLVLLCAPDLPEEDEHLDLRLLLVAQQVVHEGGHGVPVKVCRGGCVIRLILITASKVEIPVSADGDALEDAVGLVRDYVVQLVAHAAGPRHVRHRSRPG